jgi:hypothetical protein
MCTKTHENWHSKQYNTNYCLESELAKMIKLIEGVTLMGVPNGRGLMIMVGERHVC